MTEVETISRAHGHSETQRRYDVDWLRVLGMMTVFLFHCSRFFDTEGWHVKSPRTSQSCRSTSCTRLLPNRLLTMRVPS